MQNQVLSTRYIERKQLLRLLRELFGNDFLVEDRPDYYALTVPRLLTQVKSSLNTENRILQVLGRSTINFEESLVPNYIS